MAAKCYRCVLDKLQDAGLRENQAKGVLVATGVAAAAGLATYAMGGPAMVKHRVGEFTSGCWDKYVLGKTKEQQVLEYVVEVCVFSIRIAFRSAPGTRQNRSTCRSGDGPCRAHLLVSGRILAVEEVKTLFLLLRHSLISCRVDSGLCSTQSAGIPKVSCAASTSLLANIACACANLISVFT